MDPESPPRLEDSPKRVRTYFGGQLVADSTTPKLVWEHPAYPAYYFPRQDVRMSLLEPSGDEAANPTLGRAVRFHVNCGSRVAENAAWHYPESPVSEMRSLIRFDWRAMDAWFEEDEEVYVHPRDPYARVDVLSSSRHVEVVVDGVKVADSRHPRLLFETGLPTRYYLPKQDVRLDLLEPSATTTRCPYKGVAAHWSLRLGDTLHKDIAWSYPLPIPECPKIENLICFYNEKVDISVDGHLQPRPATEWS